MLLSGGIAKSAYPKHEKLDHMGEHSYKRGAAAGRSGSDPSPPKHGMFETITGVSEREVKEWARDYESGYEAGSQQRLADEIARKNK